MRIDLLEVLRIFEHLNQLLEHAIKKASSLPEDLQDAIAYSLINEIEWEVKWDETLSTNQHALENMALKALEEFKNGDTEELGFDEL